jgi:hypothetical protein
MLPARSLPHLESERQWIVNHLEYLMLVIYTVIACKHPKMKNWSPFEAKTKLTRLLHYSENVTQQSINDFESCW